jgi:hypothetical protein
VAAIGVGTVDERHRQRVVDQGDPADRAERQVDAAPRRHPWRRHVDRVADRKEAKAVARTEEPDDALHVALHLFELPGGTAAGVEEERDVYGHRFDRDRLDRLRRRCR